MAGQLGTCHTFTMSGTSQPTAAFAAYTTRVRIATGAQPAFFLIGSGTPVASATSNLLGANQVEYFTVAPGQKAAVFQAGTAGVVTVTELA